MGVYLIATLVFVVLMAITTIILYKDEKEDEVLFGKINDVKKLRTKQISGLRENALKQKFEETVEKRIKTNKRYNIESTILRAGFDWSYAELLLVQVGIAILMFIVVLMVMDNLLLGVLFGVVAYLTPGQAFGFIANQRTTRMEGQVGSFIQLVTERYFSHGDFALAIKQSAPDFKGAEPMYGEIQKTILDMEVGTPTSDSLINLARRTGNRFLHQLADYYEIASTLGTKDARERIVGQAWIQFNEDYKMKQTLKSEIAGPKNEAYIMLGFIPIMIGYQSIFSADYLPFMLTTSTGKLGCVFIAAVIMGCVWFINKKIGAPLE